jgi:protein-disulfide isomerase
LTHFLPQDKLIYINNMDGEQKDINKDYSLPISIIVASFIIAGAIIYSAGQQSDISQSRTAAVADVGAGKAAPEIGDDVVLGDPNAPVTIIEFGDFQCPFCGKLFRETEKLLRQEYIQTGKVKMVYKDFPLSSIHPYATEAAEAAQCAKDQGKYWLYHDALFERQESLGGIDYVNLAGELGMDAEQFRSCVESRKYKAEVEGDYQEGIAVGVNGTPATFVNGVLISGAQPYAVFKSAIDEALKTR